LIVQYLKKALIAFIILAGGNTYAANPKLFSVEIRNADIRDVLRMLAQMNEKNVVIPDKVEMTVSASFENTTLDNALDSILRANGLGAAVENNIIQILTLEKFKEQDRDLVTKTISLRFTNTKALLPQVTKLVSQRGSAIADERTNAITIRDTSAHIKHLQKFIKEIDIQDKRVLIEAKIVEASSDFVRRLGIEWGVTTPSSANPKIGGEASVGTSDAGRALNFSAPVTGKTTAGPAGGVALTLGQLSGTSLDAQLTVAEEHGDINILSRPSISTMNNQPAEIHSGTKFYVKTTTETGGSGGSGLSSGLQQIDAGITLQVTPQITIDDHINMKINVTESQPDFSKQIEGIPAIIDNTASTQVMLKDGEMTVIGGLKQTRTEESRRGLPFIMNLPIIGGLFQSIGIGETTTELLIFIKPTIVHKQLTELPNWK
jgi:type IV pilus assembly protein PilQ